MLETEYTNSETPMRYRCTCGNVSKMSYKNAKKGRNCAECGRKKLSKAKQMYTYEYIKEFFEENGCVLLEKEYKGNPLLHLRYICICGTESKIRWSHFKDGSRCKNCRTKKVADARRKYTIEELKEVFAEQGKELLSDKFINSQQPLEYICKCGTKAYISLNNFWGGRDCYNCRNEKIRLSKIEPNITDEERVAKRYIPELKEWRRSVFKRDEFTCQCCGNKGGRLNAHHIHNYADHADLRTELNNGITLCEECHYGFHSAYGFRNTNEAQLTEYLEKNGVAI